MKNLGFAVFSAILFVTAIQPAIAQQGSPFFTGNGGRGMTLAILPPASNGLSEDELRWMPPLVQGAMTGDFNLYSAITIIDRQNLDTVLHQQGLSMSGDFSDEDFIRIGHIANAHYVLTGAITRTATAYMLEFAVTNVQTGVRRASRPPTPVSLQAVENLSAVREAAVDLLGQLGVNLTARGRQELTRTPDMAVAQAQTALARGITAQRQGLEVEALSHFIQASGYDPELEEAAERLEIMTASLARRTVGAGAAQDIMWRRQWMERLQEAENFFVSHTQRQPYFIVYEPNIREGAINHQNETMELRFWMTAVPDRVWADTVNRTIAAVASGLRETGRAGDLGIDWPNNHVSFTEPFTNRTSELAVVVEIVNGQGVGIGRQTVNIPVGFDIHSRISRGVVPRQWEGDVVFPGVDIHAMTGNLGIRVVSVGGAPAGNAARQNGMTVMSNEELFRTVGIRRFPVDTAQFTVQPNGTLTLWGGTGTELDIPFMVNGVRVTAIGNGVFNGRGLTHVTIPDSVMSIGNEAFRNNQLTEIIIPSSVTAIGSNAFRQNQLRSVDICNSVVTIGDDAFRSNLLTNIAIPDSVTVIGNNAFRNNRLTNVIVGNNVTTIHSSAFRDNQLTNITIPNSVRAIGSLAFGNLGGITIGANVDIGTRGSNAFSASFFDFYTQNGRRAGTYRWSNNAWVFTPR